MRLRNGMPIWMLFNCAWLSVSLEIRSATMDPSREIANLVQIVADTNETSSARVEAIRSLERLGSESAPTAASLVDLLINKSVAIELRLAAISALKSVPGDERTIPAFLGKRVINGSDQTVDSPPFACRSCAAWAGEGYSL
jgi:HEAT repeat protein